MKRFIFSDNSTLIDYSTELEDYHAGSAVIDYTATEDAIYIGSELPFNSLFFNATAVNAETASVVVQYWNGTEWKTMVDILDETKASGATLAQAGHMTWTTDKNEGWAKEDTVNSNGDEAITGLGDITIYDLYWVKITFSATLTNTTELGWIGPKFCEDADLTGEFTLFGKSKFMANYGSGVSDWQSQIVMASRIMVTDIIKKNVIQNGDQLLERRKLMDACVAKTAQLIFKNLGDDYEDDKNNARTEYHSRLSLKNFSADKNANARKDESEKGVQVGGLYR